MADPLNDEEAVAWTLRRVGFGSTPADFDRGVALGQRAFLDELFEAPLGPDPWDSLELDYITEEREQLRVAAVAWLTHMIAAPASIDDWLAWFWHGHLVSSAAVVGSPLGMVTQIRLFRTSGGGRFADLLRQVTTDPAMLRYLDGFRSTGRAPNENYGRELLELFAIGIGSFTEDDVLGASRALTGWVIDREAGTSRFIPRRHDDDPQTVLGVEGVHDVDTVIDAVTSHSECARHLVRSLGAAILGPDAMGGASGALIIEEEAELLRADELRIRPLVRRLVDRGVGGQGVEDVVAPVPWLTSAARALEVEVPLPEPLLFAFVRGLRQAGQIPLFPPNVSGWPSGPAWLSASATAARFEMALALADTAAPDGSARQAAADADLDGLARALGKPGGLTPSTTEALVQANVSGPDLLALALTTPELAIS